MGTTVVKVRPEDLRRLKKILLDHTGVSERKTTNQYEVFRLSYAGGNIVAYTSGKVVTNSTDVARLVREGIMALGAKDTHTIIGSDEAGKGEWIGPLVVAAVALSSQQALELQGFGVMDSKAVPPHRMQELAAAVQRAALAYKIVLITPKKFNEMFRQFHEEGKNLNDLLAWAHAKAIVETLEQLGAKDRTPLTIIVDEFARAKARERISRVVNLSSVKLIQRPRAEDAIAVASASILARATRDDWLLRKSRSLDIDLLSVTVDSIRSHPAFEELVKIDYI
ncbi:MAG: hypothetical protein K9W43_05825 [Candidatus Thorarchaeota archaeon]|nr:hypothetical protein [Candidatus Thorarchaeota archaeon]